MKISYYAVFKLCVLLNQIKVISASHVLVSGNQDEFRDLAAKFVSQKMADHSSETASRSPIEPIIRDEEEYENDNPRTESQDGKEPEYPGYDNNNNKNNAKNNNNNDAKNQEQNNEYDDFGEDDQDGEAVNPRAWDKSTLFGQKRIVKNTSKRPKTLQVNLDELVEKVRARLLRDILTPSLTSRLPTSSFKMERIDRNHEQPPQRQQFTHGKPPQPQYPLVQQNLKVTRTTGMQSPSSILTQLYSQKQSPNPAYFTRKQISSSIRMIRPQKPKPGEVVESHDFYEKVKFKKKDSYEEYVIPQKEGDIFASDERGKNKNNGKNGNAYNGQGRQREPQMVAQVNPGNVRMQSGRLQRFEVRSTFKERPVSPSSPLRQRIISSASNNYYNNRPANPNGNIRYANNNNGNNRYRDPNANDRNQNFNTNYNNNNGGNFNNNGRQGEERLPSNGNNNNNGYNYGNNNGNNNYGQSRKPNFAANVQLTNRYKMLTRSPNSGRPSENLENRNKYKLTRDSNSNNASNLDLTFNDYIEISKAANWNQATPQGSSNNPASKVEYVDDDYHTPSISTPEQEVKAATEYIGGEDYNYKDEPRTLNPTKATKQEGYVNTKRVLQKIITNMPTKERFTMSTPNYYANLPTVAEKYNFDEPLPEKDREQETLKDIGNPPAKINGKVNLE